jgi:cytochrome c5
MTPDCSMQSGVFVETGGMVLMQGFGYRSVRRISQSIACVLVACLPLASVADGEKSYDVDCDQVDEDGEKICLTDKGTYVGWRTFHATCHACHGQNAVGSSFAPSLLKPIDKARFVDVVMNGYSGQIGVMPAWGQNPNVKDFVDELYAYQQARADGVLRPGRPKRKD